MVDIVGIKFVKDGFQRPCLTSLTSGAFGLKSRKPVSITFRNRPDFWDISTSGVEYILIRYTGFWFFGSRNVLELRGMYRENKSLTLRWVYNGEQVKQRTIGPSQICDAVFNSRECGINGSFTGSILGMKGPVLGRRVFQKVPPAYFDTEL